ncbi:MAG: hypothetical protein CME70_00210 [Halobacteriovorax sp.]|nr:hypothetical protein [Halobacteriovorax sp.]|tara:strand:- start:322 stop:3078 length:2757 start_codon:yes stop_codon:yes gene_type:complete
MNPPVEHSKTPKNSSIKEKGQLSVFLGVSMTIIVSLLAFIINVGLFVKAKINLQNAVDSAAWAGASVQARQLTNIGYLNWEMRNNYKEWMFKQYVLGQIALSTVADTSLSNNPKNGNLLNGLAGDRMQFRGQPFDPAGYPDEFDKFNLPSICIHFGSGHNICDLVRLPGLPRFNTVGLPSITEHHEEVLSALAKTKRDDCSRRTEVNFGAALLWAYGTGEAGGLSFEDMPLIASSRVGAWIKAMELGLRMRNLEAHVNRPPVSEGICFSCGDGMAISNLNPIYAANERPIKAFWSALRNLGGGDFKMTDASANVDERAIDEVPGSFKLFELAPQDRNPGGLSDYLIPNDAVVQGVGYNPKTKFYLDLQALPVNFVSFFTTFVSLTGKFDDGGETIAQEANCGGSKTGMPVPGFMFGFLKNPEVMTYYAVKGEANFVGLFFPFQEQNGIKISAYAAAKPFGGRVGPKLFMVDNFNTVKPRVENEAKRSGAYISAIQVPTSLSDPSVPIADRYPPGTPFPLTQDFWAQDKTDVIGGTPNVGDVKFVIPNLLYDYTDDSSMDLQVKTDLVLEIKAAASLDASRLPDEAMGLHSTAQFDLFKANYEGTTAAGDIIPQERIERAINNVRRPTKYEALNYLVPVIDGTDGVVNENISTIMLEPEGCSFVEADCYKLYAPLFGDGTMFSDQAAPSAIIADTVSSFEPAIDKFLDALKDVSDSIRAQVTEEAGGSESAANSIFRRTPPPASAPVVGLPTGAAPFTPPCNDASLAQNFHHFFKGNGKACDITPINELILEYFDKMTENESFQEYHVAPYVTANNTPADTLRSGYMPGVRQGAQEDGTVPAAGPITPSAEFLSARRNFYSTKFIPMSSLIGGADSYADDARWMFIEKSLSSPPGDKVVGGIKNQIDPTDLDLWEKLFF